MKVRANGISIDYAASGSEGAPVVVLLHSLATSRAAWVPQVEALEGRFRVITPDLRGHGATDAPAGPYSMEMLADDVAGLIEALDLGKVRFVGLSIGGMVGQALAQRRPDLLAGLVLASTTSRLPPNGRQLWDERIAQVRKSGMASQVTSTLERWFMPSCREQRPALMSRVAGMISGTPVAGFIGCGRAIQDMDLAGGLPGIKVPTLVMVGREDPGTPVSAAEAIHGAIPGSRLVVIEDASHQAGLEQPEAFNTALLGFFRDLS